MNLILSDRCKFLHCRKDPTKEIQQKAEKLVNKLKLKSFLSDREAKKLIVNYPKAPRIYGLPKTHKSLRDDSGNIQLKLRPIVSFINSPLYNISKYLANILSKVNEDSVYDLKNSYECVDKLENVILPPNYLLISLDVTAMYDNITSQMAINGIKEEWDVIKEHTNMPKALFIELAELCLHNNYCQFQGNFFIAKVGLPMGGSSSVPISSITMNILLRKVLPKLPFEVPFCFRYVDDLLLSIPKDQVEATLKTFNSYSGWLKFTIEIEKDGVLPYLDMEIHRSDDGSLSTVWYSKPTSTNRLINFHSNHNFLTKLNCAQGLINRVYRLTTKPKMEKWKLDKCMDVLSTNNYPTTLVKRLINKFLNPPPAPDLLDQENTNTGFKYRSLVYVKGLSEQIAKIIKAEDPTIQISFRNNLNTNPFFSKLKDPMVFWDTDHIIYCIPCECGAVYIGMTIRMLRERLYDHQSNIKKLEAATTIQAIEDAVGKTALVQHAQSTGHKFDLKKTKILKQCSNTFKLPIFEMLEIQFHSNAINLKSDTNNLNRSYIAIVDIFKRMR
jgi:predicted GIY-YIG superfamily endonuclease